VCRTMLRRSAGKHGDVAQLVEHLFCKQEVAGSSPAVSTTGFRDPGSEPGTRVPEPDRHCPFPREVRTGRAPEKAEMRRVILSHRRRIVSPPLSTVRWTLRRSASAGGRRGQGSPIRGGRDHAASR
jgi:hypothetical protein